MVGDLVTDGEIWIVAQGADKPQAHSRIVDAHFFGICKRGVRNPAVSSPPGIDTLADWPILNALINAVNGASWVSFHHGGGVGMGYSLHAGQVIVADGTDEAARRLDRVLIIDPGMGVARHVDAGYDRALEAVKKVSRRHSPAAFSGFFALNTRLILRIGLRLIALKPKKASRRASVRLL